jgi:transposase IS116/IS110/IS902 family protein
MQLKLLRQIPSIAPIRAALLVALLQTPHRFRSKRQLWAYSGFAVEVHDSGEYRWVRGKLQRNRERITVRGLNDNHNKDVKSLFKAAAITASTRPGPLHDFYVARVESGMRPTMARLTLARKIAAITLTIVDKARRTATCTRTVLSKKSRYRAHQKPVRAIAPGGLIAGMADLTHGFFASCR